MSYKVEELLALRDSVSESAVSIEKFADEDVIKEHVLRPSASAILAAAPSNKSLRSTATPALTPAAPVKKPSPSPSIKRGKAERLLKEHGSPPGIRVTAGGRIVPSELPPVLNNRFVNSTFKLPALRGIPITNTMSTQSRPDTNNVPRLEVVGSQPVLYVGDRVYALPALDTANASAPVLGPGAIDAAPKSAETLSGLSARSSFTSAPPARGPTPTPFADLDIETLKAQQTLKKQELRTVEQTEVLQASHQTDAWRATVIEKKRNLIIELDALRKQITALEATENNKVLPAQSNGFSSVLGSMPASVPPAPFVPQFQQSMPSPMYGFQGASSYPPMMMYQPQPPFAGYPNMPPAEHTPYMPHPVQAPQSPGSASRRSHAIQIKPPPEENKKQMTSALDPKSPTYEPVEKHTTIAKNVPPTPSPAKSSSWRINGVSQIEKCEDRALSQKPSLSSIDTTDFFPTNTHEHSSTRVAPKATESIPMTNETSVVPSTPEKNWPASPWNEGKSTRSSHKAVAKFPSWPECFGKQPSTGSLRQNAAAQPSTTVQERLPLPSTAPLKSTFSGSTSARQTTDQRFGTEDTWPLVSSKPISHMPSTYQEGFQAGYDHVGIPDSPDVLKGYIQGLLQFLQDESKKGLNNSLRGLVASSQPHDSAISMTFNRADAPVGGQENIRSSRINSATDTRKDSACGTSESPFVYTHCNESAQEQQMRNLSPHMYMSSISALDRVLPGYQQTALSATENSLAKKSSEKGTLPRTEAAMLGPTIRQFSGNQLTNRAYGTPISSQRYNHTVKEYSMKGFNGDVSSFARPMANQRLSGLDGAMDDLADMVRDTHIKEQSYRQHGCPPSTTDGQRSTDDPHPTDASRFTDAPRSLESVDDHAFCFRPSSSKGKQKVLASPVKSTPGERSDATVPTQANTSSSPKKSGEHSPAKAKLEQVTNKFRRKKDDMRNLSPDQKKERAIKWRKRFRQLKDEEEKDIQDHRRTTPSNGDRR
ncbi:meiotic recombination [Kalmusia sp. IMI 367209]|nr:meiotic recombination [Kalmusia sp. IMI 367209]